MGSSRVETWYDSSGRGSSETLAVVMVVVLVAVPLAVLSELESREQGGRKFDDLHSSRKPIPSWQDPWSRPSETCSQQSLQARLGGIDRFTG